MRAAVVVAVAVVLASAPSTVAQAPPGDSVTGDLFDNATFLFVGGIDARSGASGETPAGTATWHVGGGLGPTWSVSVSCLAVTGNVAVVGFSGIVRFFGEESPVAGLARVVDGGGPGSGQDSFAWAETRGAPGGPAIPGPADCSSYPAGFPIVFSPSINRTAGDIVVVDAAPLPTLKEQCKNGGWRNYGVFKNQGDCVSFVATGGTNAPAGQNADRLA